VCVIGGVSPAEATSSSEQVGTANFQTIPANLLPPNLFSPFMDPVFFFSFLILIGCCWGEEQGGKLVLRDGGGHRIKKEEGDLLR
jgi:hypothetical protein